MIIRRLLESKSLDKDMRETLVGGLIFGLGGGLIFGLTFGLIFGLTFGLTFGLVNGLFNGLVSGLIIGLVNGLVFGLFSRQYGLPIPIMIVLGIIAIISMEILYYLAVRNKPQHQVSLWWVLGRKLEELGEVLFVIVNGINVWWVITKAGINWNTVGNGIKTFGGYLIFIIAGLAVIILWLWLNKKIVPIKEPKKPTAKKNKRKQ